MRELRRAIAEREPVDRFPAASPLAGLRRGSIGPFDVIAQSVAAIAPAGVLTGLAFNTHRAAGDWGFASLLIGMAVTAGLVAVLGWFSSRFAGAGSLYTAVVLGLGPRAGLVGGVLLAVGTLVVASQTLRAAAGRSLGILLGEEPPDAVLLAAIAVLALLVAAIVALGARAMTRVLLIVETLAVLFVLALAIALLATEGLSVDGLLPDLAVAPDAAAIASAVTVAMIAFVGIESGMSLGGESRRPLRSVPRALRWTVIIVGVVYLLGATAQYSAFDAQGSPARLGALIDAAGLGSVDLAVDLVVALSFFACSLALAGAFVRILLSMAREGLLPAALGRTDARRGAPLLATAVAAAGLLAVPALGQLHPALAQATSTLAHVGFLGSYALACGAAPVFLRRIGELTVAPVVVGGLCALVLAGVVVLGTSGAAQRDPLGVVIGLGVLALLCGGGLLRLAHRPGLREAVGVYDAPEASRTIGGRG